MKKVYEVKIGDVVIGTRTTGREYAYAVVVGYDMEQEIAKAMARDQRAGQMAREWLEELTEADGLRWSIRNYCGRMDLAMKAAQESDQTASAVRIVSTEVAKLIKPRAKKAA